VALTVEQDAPGRAGAGCRDPAGLPAPVEAVQTWLAAAEISAGPLFNAAALDGRVSDVALADDSAARIVKR
jgi:hypothetical protein